MTRGVKVSEADIKRACYKLVNTVMENHCFFRKGTKYIVWNKETQIIELSYDSRQYHYVPRQEIPRDNKTEEENNWSNNN